MGYLESNVWDRWEKSGGRCECENTDGHENRCPNKLVFILREQNIAGGWNVLQARSNEDDKKQNESVRIFCWDCFQKTNA